MEGLGGGAARDSGGGEELACLPEGIIGCVRRTPKVGGLENGRIIEREEGIMRSDFDFSCRLPYLCAAVQRLIAERWSAVRS